MESHPTSLLHQESTHPPHFASTISPGYVELTAPLAENSPSFHFWSPTQLGHAFSNQIITI